MGEKARPSLRRGGNEAAELREDEDPGAVDVGRPRAAPEDADQGRRRAALEEDRRAAVSAARAGQNLVLTQHRDRAVRDVAIDAGVDHRSKSASRGAPDLEEEGAGGGGAEQEAGDGQAWLDRADLQGPQAHAPEEWVGDLRARGERGGVVGGERRVRKAALLPRRARAAGEKRRIDGLDAGLAAPVRRALREGRPAPDAARGRAVGGGDEAFDACPEGVGAKRADAEGADAARSADLHPRGDGTD